MIQRTPRDTPDDLGGPQTHSERLKVDYARVMRALHRSMKSFASPGIHSGVPEVAELIGCSANSLTHQFSPTDYDHAPTTHRFLEVIQALGPLAAPAVLEIAALADCVTIPRALRAHDVGAQPDNYMAFSYLTALSAIKLRPTLGRMQAGHTLTAAESAKPREALNNVIAYAAHLLTRLD